jgi:hypothetical protein
VDIGAYVVSVVSGMVSVDIGAAPAALAGDTTAVAVGVDAAVDGVASDDAPASSNVKVAGALAFRSFCP